MNQPENLPTPGSPGDGVDSNSTFQQEIQRLYKLTLYGRWLFVGLLWLTVGSLSLWGLRSEIALWMDYFTWAAVRYGLAYNRVYTFGLAFCIGITTSVLVRQSQHLLFGMPEHEKKRLLQKVNQIRKQGPSHPFWRWVCQDSPKPEA
jgi:hypothetical protein